MATEYFSLEYVAQVLQVSYLTVYRWVRAGKLSATKVGRQYRVSQQSFSDFLTQGQLKRTNLVAASLDRFIKSGLLDYSYMESRAFPTDLSLGINPLGAPFDVRRFFAKQKIDYSKYSSVTAVSLRKKIAYFHSLSSDQILVGAGASELLHVAFLTFLNPGDDVLIPTTSFPAFEMLAILVRASCVFIDLTPDFNIDYLQLERAISSQTKLVVLCNPNNPTGLGLNIAKTVALVAKFPEVIFLIDEANIDFGGESLISHVQKLPNLVVARSFSKGFGLAGLRVGYLAAHTDLIYAMQRRQTPFMTNVVGQVVAERALDFPKFLAKSRQFSQEQRRWLAEEINKIGLITIESDSNYLLVDVQSSGMTSTQLIAKLNKAGANAIDGKDFRGLGTDYIRISPRDKKTNRAFIAVLKKLQLNF